MSASSNTPGPSVDKTAEPAAHAATESHAPSHHGGTDSNTALQNRPAPDRVGAEGTGIDTVSGNASGHPNPDNAGASAEASPTGHTEATRDTEEASAYHTHSRSSAAGHTPVTDKPPLK